MAVRSNYIKNLMEQKNNLEAQYQEVVAETMKNIIGENAKDGIRELLKEAEDEDSYEEEVVDDVDTPDDKEEDTAEGDEAEGEGVEEGGEDTDVEDTEDTDVEGTEDTDIWDDLESCKGEDGEYDCRGMDNDSLVKVLKVMGPEDGIRVISNGDNTVTVEVDPTEMDGETEFVLDLDDFGTEDVEEPEFELELESKGNTGYTTDYQKQTAMTVDNNDETADPKTTYSMDAGVPKGTKKPWAQDGDRQPYNQSVNEEVDECGGNIFEVEVDDEEMVDEASHTVTQNNGNVRGVTRSFPTNSSSQQTDRNGAPEAQSPTTGKGRGTGDGYKEAENESREFKRKMNKLYEENKQMKSLIPQLQEKITESMVVNASMGYIVRLLNENTTTVDEKRQITEKFSKVSTLEEGKKLYEEFSNTLKKVQSPNDVTNVINSQLSESKQRQNIVETTVYRSEKVNEALDFMKRLDNIK